MGGVVAEPSAPELVTMHAESSPEDQPPVLKRPFPALTLAGAALILLLCLFFRPATAREQSMESLRTLHAALANADAKALLDRLVLPPPLRGRTVAEQEQFVRKALADELSPEGLAALQRKGQFGPLKEIFPQEGPRWAEQAGVPAEECVAFRLERDGLVAEVVLHRKDGLHKILRCNNVKQMADSYGKLS